MKNIVLQIALLLTCTNAFAADESLWSKYNKAGEEAYKRGDMSQATGLFRAALNEAQKPGAQSTQLASSLLKLAKLYKSQGRNAEAEPLLRSYALVQQQIQKKTQHSQASQPNQGSKPSTTKQRTGGGWDANDLRINRTFSF